jgi:hypothetical protein
MNGKKDREYRESAKQRRLVLENLSRENQVISERKACNRNWSDGP